MEPGEGHSIVAWSSRWVSRSGLARAGGTSRNLGLPRCRRLPAFPALATLVALAALVAAPLPATAQTAAPHILRDSIPGTLVDFELVEVPGGTVVLRTADGADTVAVEPFYMGRTEVTWDMYDAFWLRLDETEWGAPEDADAVARPSMPYSVPDYGWGHAGYAAMNIAYPAAQAFTEWLSLRTGQPYRLATEAEWVHAALLAAGGPELAPDRADALAWHRGNADRRTHPVGSREPDALGLYDLFGNVAEWVLTDDDPPVALGGSFRDEPEALGPFTRRAQQPRWTERDPQIPRGRWWLTDGPFVGFRIVRIP